MKAVLCKEYGPPSKLVLEDIPSEPTAGGQVKIRVRAAGVNFPDVLIIKGEYQFKPTPPFSPGAEVAGDVLEVGPGVTAFKPGDRVIGMCGWNGFREEVVIGAERCLGMPASMDYDTGAALTMTYGTSYHALVQRGRLAAGETLLVLGATGGVGTAAIEIGKLLGATIIAAGGNDEKLAAIKDRYRVEHVLNYATSSLKDQVKTMTGGAGANVVYDAVGGDLFEQSLRSIAWDGRLLVVGFAGGTIPQAKANLVLLKGCAIVGVFWGAFTAREPETNRKNFEQLFRWFEEGKLKPSISHRFPLERAADALDAIVRREVVGKAIVTVA
ncbi:MAG TPA: NADPH:quinone oxidoreductase family protein [Polyangiaceae bacterium]|jgi:NADPH2:quinone reductase|nr:NADPH:quinone oxidoreductase family protein [Polyangiaceae bacterium]